MTFSAIDSNRMYRYRPFFFQVQPVHIYLKLVVTLLCQDPLKRADAGSCSSWDSFFVC